MRFIYSTLHFGLVRSRFDLRANLQLSF
jgi:hypothetical protein